MRHQPIVVQLGPWSHAWGLCPRRNSSRVVGVPGRESGSRTRPSKTPTNAPRRAATNPPTNAPNKSRADFPHTELLSTELSAEDGVVTFMDLPERGSCSVEQTSLSALIGRGSHGSALSGQGFGHAGKTPPPLHACPYSSKRSYKVCGSREGTARDSASDSESPVRRVKHLFSGVVGLFVGWS